MAISETRIVTLYDDIEKTIAFAPRTKVSAISNDSGTGLQALLDNKLSLSGGTLTGNLTGKYITGTWLQNTSNTNLGSASSKVVVQDASGWLYYRTPAQILSDAEVTSTVAELNILDGVTATTTELNYVDGVTSNIQTQLNDKLSLSGGKMTGTLKFQSSSLPNKTLSYVCGIDAFDSGGEMGWQSKADFLSDYATTSQLSNYLPLAGGTVTGDFGVAGTFYPAGPIRIHHANGTSGSSGYIKFAQIKINSTYTNAPLMFSVGQRGKSATCFFWVSFQNANSTDPGLAAFRHLAFGSTYNLYIVKSATSTWDLYIAKSESYDRMGLSYYFTSQDGVSVSYTNVQASSVPSGYVASTLVCQTTSFVSSSQPTAISTGDIWFVT